MTTLQLCLTWGMLSAITLALIAINTAVRHLHDKVEKSWQYMMGEKLQDPG